MQTCKTGPAWDLIFNEGLLRWNCLSFLHLKCTQNGPVVWVDLKFNGHLFVVRRVHLLAPEIVVPSRI